MPSGAKKRKAAKKKMQKEAHNSKDVSNNPQGTDSGKSHDERESDGGEGEREFSERGVKEEVSVGDQNDGEYSKEMKSEENSNDVMVNNAEDDVDKTKNGKHKSKSSSSSSSSSEDDEVPVEKDKPVEQQVSSSFSEAYRENPVITEVYNLVEETIPVEESVKQVVSLPQEGNTKSESALVDNSVTSHIDESGSKQKVDEVLPSADEKDKFPSSVSDFVQEKIETKLIQVVDEGLGNLSESVDNTARDEGLPESCDVRSADASNEDNHVKEVETHKYVEEQPLISSTPMPVRRTSLMNCCGLFEVFSGGASR